MTSIDGTGDEARGLGIRAWPVWQLPPRLLWPIVVVELTAILLMIVCLVDRPMLGRPELMSLAVLGGLGLIHTELSRDVERVRWRLTGDLHVDLTSVWVFAAAVALPAGYAAVLALTVHTYLWLRSARTRAPLHRQVFSTATIVLSCLAAATVMHHVRTAFPLLATPAGMLPAAVLGILVFLTVNSALVAGAIAISTAGGSDVRALLGEWDENLVEVAALSLGAIVGAIVPADPWIIPLALLPLLVLQRAALVKTLVEAASHDEKTGLLTAGAWHAQAEAVLKRPSPGGGQHAVLVLDLDYFKSVNDRHGHLAGDAVLAAVAEALRAEVRDGDLVGRFGGEEFVVLLTGKLGGATAEVAAIADRLRRRIADLRVEIPTPDGPLTITGLTVSVGAALQAEQADVTDLLQIADVALYAAKRGGRDQVRIGQEPPDAGPADAPLPSERAGLPHSVRPRIE